MTIVYAVKERGEAGSEKSKKEKEEGRERLLGVIEIVFNAGGCILHGYGWPGWLISQWMS